MKLQIHLTPGAVTQFLLRVVTCLVVLSFLTQMTLYFLPDYPLRDFFARSFNVDGEVNIPTLYSFLALLFSSILLGVIAYAKKLHNCRYQRHWKILSFIFLYLSLDEAGQIHENLINPMRSLLHASTGFLYFAWVVPFGFLVAIFLFSYSKFMWHLPVSTRKFFVAAAAIYIGGALGTEMLGGYESSRVGEDNIVYQIIVTVEESLEMLGIVVFIHGLMSYIKAYFGEVSCYIYIPRKNLQPTQPQNIGLAGIREPANTRL